MIHKIPDNVSYEQGALVEPSAVALYSNRKKKASEFGAVVLDPKEVHVVEGIHKHTNGGVDVTR